MSSSRLSPALPDRLSERRPVSGVVVLATLLTATCWTLVVTGWVGPESVVSAVGPGVVAEWSLAHPLAFLVWWAATVGALVVPASGYELRDYDRSLDGSAAERLAHLVAFLAPTFTFAIASGGLLLALAAAVSLPQSLSPAVAGLFGAVAGWQRLTTLSHRWPDCCLRCRGPFSARLAALAASVRRGAAFGRRTLRAQWPVLVLLVAVAPSSTVSLALLTGVLAVESVPGFGDDVRVAVGWLALPGGLVVGFVSLLGLL